VTSERASRRFNEMVLPHLDDAYGLARWLTGNGADAEDVVQDVCLKAFAAMDTALAADDRPEHHFHLASKEPAEDLVAD
jgi:DNA-directed RNA polymerase specialized sigma24 family protein